MKSFEDNRVEIVEGDKRDQTINTHTLSLIHIKIWSYLNIEIYTLNQSQLPDQSQTIEKEKKSS